jgi:hypothetical protein
MAGLVYGVGDECNGHTDFTSFKISYMSGVGYCTCHILLNSSKLYSNYPSSISSVEFQDFLSRDGCHLKSVLAA